MEWFGDNWGAAVCENPKVETPVGILCSYCHRAIERENQGVVMPFVDAPLGDPHVWWRSSTVGYLAYHLPCLDKAIGFGRR